MFRFSSAHTMSASRQPPLALVLLTGIPVCTVTAASTQVGFSPEGTAGRSQYHQPVTAICSSDGIFIYIPGGRQGLNQRQKARC